VDAIDTRPRSTYTQDRISPQKLAMLNRRIEQEQQSFTSLPPQPSAILQFPNKLLTALTLPTHHLFPNCVETHYLGTSTEDIIWRNLLSTWWER
jgi:hypothetical protein